MYWTMPLRIRWTSDNPSGQVFVIVMEVSCFKEEKSFTKKKRKINKKRKIKKKTMKNKY